ncbi:MAG TPA: hypothetical protein DCR21_03870 [Succinivibrionaceae bacterium]|nr:hypothetical protein [Succinivibrionaceae bacterium]
MPETQMQLLGIDDLWSGFLQIAELPSVILFLCMLIEFALPIPNRMRLNRLTPIFQAAARKVNKRENTLSQTYFAGIMLPTLIILLVALALLSIEVVTGFDDLVALVVMPFLLESRVAMLCATGVSSALKEGNKAKARQILKPYVLRDVKPLSAVGLSKAACETCLIRTFTSWFAILVWYTLAGIAGAIIMQVVCVMARAFNSKLYENSTFGAAIARFEQGMLLPAAICIMVLRIFSFSPLKSLKGWLNGGRYYPSQVTGFIIGLYGRVLNISLGGPRIYEGQKVRYHKIGGQNEPDEKSPVKAFHKIRFTGILYCCLYVIVDVFILNDYLSL